MKKALIALAAFLGVAALTGCGANVRDLEGVPIKEPQKIEIYANLDKHPNIVRLCIDGIAWVTTTRELESVTRVPEYDAWCKA